MVLEFGNLQDTSSNLTIIGSDDDSHTLYVVFVFLFIFKYIVLDKMFVSFCLIIKYTWVLNQLSLNCGIVPGNGLAPIGRQAIS